MDAQDAVDLAREALLVAALISAPILAAGMFVGLLVGLLQALTQIQEQTVAFVPKLAAMALTLGIALPWLLTRILEYTEQLIANIPNTMQLAMPLVENFLYGQFAAFVLVLARVGALVMTAPLFGTRAAPVLFRAFLAVAIALIITPLFAGQTHADVGNLWGFGKLVLNETLVGLLLGVGLTIMLGGVQLTGQLISQLGGTALADVFDPAVDENVPVYAQMFNFLTLAMFVLLDGHRLTAEALLDTYAWLPPGQALAGESFVAVLATLMGQSFQLGIRAAAPAMAALLLATLVLGLVGRTLPQINVLAVGFSLNALVTVGFVWLSIGAIAWAFPQQAAATLELLQDAVRQAAEVGRAPPAVGK